MIKKLSLALVATILTASIAAADDIAGATGFRPLANTVVTYGNLAGLWYDDAYRINAQWTGGGSSSEVRVRLEFDLYNPLLGWKSYRHLWVQWNGSADSRSLNRIYLLDRDGNYQKVAENSIFTDEKTFATQVLRPNRFILPGGGAKMKMDLRMTRQSLFRLDMVRIIFVD
ncbi:MAG: hypothetical protein K1X67_11665 [Fimbriimonadaceae bacterium]|nr:hypothetical protein [Fimbriimonadaceae bacterium]